MTEARERILDAALALLLSDSYHKVSIDQVAQRAGVSKGGLFHHFGSKVDLASAALLRAFDLMWRDLIVELEAVDDPRERLRQMIQYSLAAVAQSTQLMRVTLEVLQEGAREGRDSTEVARALASFEEPIARWLGECDVPDPGATSVILLAALDGLAAQSALLAAEEREMDVEALAERVYGLFVGRYEERTTP
jgi:AcrR family transcriptional regulator